MLRCSKEAFAACPESQSCGCREEATFTEGSECDKFNQSVANSCKPVITNADRLRAMTAEEFAKFMLYADQQNFTVDVCDSAYCDVCDNDNHHGEKCSEGGCIAAIVKWLSSEDSIKTDKAGDIIHA